MVCWDQITCICLSLMFTACGDSPLRKAILRESEHELRTALDEYRCRDASEGPDPGLHAAAAWTPGLRKLRLDITQHDENGYSVLDWAIKFGNMESFQMLIPDLALLTNETWYVACLSQDSDVIGAVALALNRKFRLDFPGHPQSPMNQASAQVVDYRGLFHNYSLRDDSRIRFDAVRSLFQAGFEDVDVDAPGFGTPLWFYAEDIWDRYCIRLILWLLEKGARITWQHPRWRTMPLHLIAEKLALYSQVNEYGQFVAQDESYLHTIMYGNVSTLSIGTSVSFQSDAEPSLSISATDDTSRTAATDFDDSRSSSPAQNLINIIFQDSWRDHCPCHCSVEGCSVISASLKAMVHHGYTDSVNQEIPIEHITRRSIHTTLGFYPSKTDHPWICGSVLRAATFHALGLTHTCHDHGHPNRIDLYDCRPKDPLPIEDVADIQYAEQEDIKLLEELPLEFEGAWEAYDRTLLEFLDGPWSTRIEEVLDVEKATRGDEAERLVEIGVVLSKYGPELPPSAEEEAKSVSWEWFEQRVKEIRDGT